MSALAWEKRPPTYSTTAWVDVDVDIDPDELEAAGWVYVGEGAGSTNHEALIRLIRDMHDDEHDGPMRWCGHPVCQGVER